MKRDLDCLVENFPASLELEFIDAPKDLEHLRELLGDVPLEHRVDLEERHRAGQRCYVARHRGRVVHAAWLAFGHCYSYLLDRTYELAPDQAYLYGSYTQPEFRQRGIQLAGTCHRLQVLRAQGFRSVVGLVDPANPLAHRTHPKTGYGPAGISGYIEVFGVRLYFHRDHDAFTALRRPWYWRKM
jgi:ribosomal protein S18 acetylase RimI-like enzyme